MNDDTNKEHPQKQPTQTSPPDLWPDLITQHKVRAPVTVLKEQASLLGPKTQNIVVATVNTATNEGGSIIYIFALVAPALGNYSLQLFTISHQLISVTP